MNELNIPGSSIVDVQTVPKYVVVMCDMMPQNTNYVLELYM